LFKINSFKSIDVKKHFAVGKSLRFFDGQMTPLIEFMVMVLTNRATFAAHNR
jgi:hypothetical protein